jgi:hypothetical protein
LEAKGLGGMRMDAEGRFSLVGSGQYGTRFRVIAKLLDDWGNRLVLGHQGLA